MMGRRESTPTGAVHEIESAWITMSDGCRLAARIFMPDGATAAPVPAILEYIPYRKRDFTRRRDEGMHRYFAAHGYAAVRVDMRGSGESDGILNDEYLALEQDDALEVIDWISRQPWCSGAVGMMGKSWGAFNALQVAARRPPALKAIVAVMGTDDRYAEDVHYAGGCLLNENFSWGCIMQAFNARPPDPQIVGEQWRAMWLARLEAERFWPQLWLEHQTLDGYWKHASVCFDYEAIVCPVWLWGGWEDLYRDTPFRLAAHLRVPHKVTVGPWAHLYPHEAIPQPAVGFLEESVKWWEQWLKGRDTGLMREPPLRFYMMDSVRPQTHYTERPGRWIAEREWPSASVRTRTLALDAQGLVERAGAESARSLASAQSTGLAAADWGSFGVPGDVPGDQRLDSFGSLEFDSAPLTDSMEILGNTHVILKVAADRPNALVAVRLIDVAPDGSATMVARGVLNLTHRTSREAPTPLVPDEPYRVDVQLTGTAYAFPAGHRIRVAVSNAYWPIVWPSPEPVTLTVFTGTSQLLLPVRSADAQDGALRPLPAPECGLKSPMRTVREGRLERSVAIDQVTGTVTHRLYIDGGVFGDVGKILLEDVDLEMAHVFEKIYRIHPNDPNSAYAAMTQTYEMGRSGWQVKIDAGAAMTSSASTFELDAWLEAYEGDKSVFRKEWRSSIPRNNL
ncbi:MAG: CocE/NonD family hydrolase [Steroidobacteraceae bacterium]|jgi:putative CocE/NonD family hydrolase